MKLVALRKGNHPGEAQVRTGRRKALYTRERDSLEGPQEEAEIHVSVFAVSNFITFSDEERFTCDIGPSNFSQFIRSND